MAADGASSVAAVGLSMKYGLAAKLAALVGTGTIGALLVAAVDPAEALPDPKARRKLIFGQVVSAAVVAPMFTPATVRALDSTFAWVQATSSVEAWAAVAMPVGLLWGCLAWGILGAMVKLRQIVRDRAAGVLAKRAGLTD